MNIKFLNQTNPFMCNNTKRVDIMSNRGNRPNTRGRHRRLYNLTGVPGWIRFGNSPGFAGGGRGLGPCAQYLQETGQMNQFLESHHQSLYNQYDKP